MPKSLPFEFIKKFKNADDYEKRAQLVQFPAAHNFFGKKAVTAHCEQQKLSFNIKLYIKLYSFIS
jgi:hypothetical protein